MKTSGGDKETKVPEKRASSQQNYSMNTVDDFWYTEKTLNKQKIYALLHSFYFLEIKIW